MSMLQDPDMQEVIDEFCDESAQLCENLEEILDEYSDDLSNTPLLEKFGQTVDRIMGAAKSLGADKTGTASELGKIVSYKASQVSDTELLNIVSAVLYDNVEYIQMLIDSIRKNKSEVVSNFNDQAFIKRLRWLSEKFSDISRSSVSIDSEIRAVSGQDDIDNLLKNLGF